MSTDKEQDAMVSKEDADELRAESNEERFSFHDVLQDVPLKLSVELGRATMNLDELASRLGPGSIIPLDKMAGDKLDVRVNGRLIAKAEAVAVGDRCGVRIVQVVGPSEGDLS